MRERVKALLCVHHEDGARDPLAPVALEVSHRPAVIDALGAVDGVLSKHVETAVGTRTEAAIEVVDEEVGRIVLGDNRVVVVAMMLLHSAHTAHLIPSRLALVTLGHQSHTITRIVEMRPRSSVLSDSVAERVGLAAWYEVSYDEGFC